ncbi:unnamed protein product [Effrenium voratum]|nr:unnamed protein product [Effrenium voratum]
MPHIGGEALELGQVSSQDPVGSECSDFPSWLSFWSPWTPTTQRKKRAAARQPAPTRPQPAPTPSDPRAFAGDGRAFNGAFAARPPRLELSSAFLARQPRLLAQVARLRPQLSTDPLRHGFDVVVRCLGWRANAGHQKGAALKLTMPKAMQKYPRMDASYQSVEMPGLYFAGAVSHGRDYRRSAGGFIHGFRYTARALYRILADGWPNRSFSLAQPEERMKWMQQVLLRVNEAAGPYQMFGELVDVVLFSPNSVQYLEELPAAYAQEQFGLRPRLQLSFVYGRRFSALDLPSPGAVGPEFAEFSAFLHPRLELFAPCGGPGHCPPALAHALVEDVFTEWRSVSGHVAPLFRFLQACIERVSTWLQGGVAEETCAYGVQSQHCAVARCPRLRPLASDLIAALAGATVPRAEGVEGTKPRKSASARSSLHGEGESAEDILCAYWWQLLYSHQELAARGESHTHPLLPSLAREKEGKALEELSTKLLRPVLQNLQELPLKQVTACLTALAPPVRPPDVISQEDRGLVREAVASAFAGASGEVEGVPVFVEGWMQDFWDAELRGLTAAELLELACGLREAGMDWRFPMTLIMAEINRRLRLSPGQQRQEVELSHFLLLRLCRIMDLWPHEVENMLKSMLSNPEALRPLPTAYFVGVLTALSSFPVPKDLPLRLASSFLDREELGEVAVLPEQWADLLCAVRPLDEPFFERLTPRLLQQLLPHLSGLPDPVLLRLLEVLAAAPPKEKGEIVPASPLEQAPGAFSVAMAEVVKSGRWDLQKVLTAFDCLGKLGWYDERAVAEVLRCILATHFLEPHAPLLLPLLQACNRLHVHHAALLQKARASRTELRSQGQELGMDEVLSW